MIRLRNPQMLFVALLLMALAVSTSAEVPNVVNYQGRLTDDGGQPVNGSKLIKFKIYGSPSGDDSLWSSNYQTVQIAGGLFNYELGSSMPLPEDLFTGGATRYLGITVDTDAELEPRAQFVTVPYAFRAVSADTASYAFAGPGGGAWVDDGQVVRLATTTDNVGIGTLTAGERLVVGKDIGNFGGRYIVSGSPWLDDVCGFKMGFSADNHTTLEWNGDGVPFAIHTRQQGINYNNTIILNSGRVGIGTSYPEGALHVVDSFMTVASVILVDSATGNGLTARSSAGNGVYAENNYSGATVAIATIGGGINAYQGPEGSYAGRFSGDVHMTSKLGVGFNTGGLPDFTLDVRSSGTGDGLRVTRYGHLDSPLFRVRENSDGSCETQISDLNGTTKVMLRAVGASYFNGGSVGIGTTTPNYTLDVRGSIGNNTTLYHSDRRWKKNVTTLDSALQKTMQLRGVSYDWNRDAYGDMNFPEGRQIGLIAQEIESIVPEVVNTADDGFKSVDYAKLVAVLVESIKEQQSQIESLSQRVKELEGMNVAGR